MIIGFIGIGAMGRPMSAQLMAKGYTVVAHDIVPERAEAVRSMGGRTASCARDVANQCEIVVTMVPNTSDVESVAFGPGGLAETDRRDLLLVDMSTISPPGSRAIAARLAERGVGMVDAPVTGSTFKAETGELNMFVGATDADFARAEPILRAMGTPQRVGPQGSGALVKILHNTIVGTSMVAIIESFAMAARSGIDLAWLQGVLMKGTCRSFLLEEWIPRTLLKGDFSKGFFSKHMAKDLGIALELARALNVPAFSTASSQQVYAQTASFGLDELDLTKIIQLYTGPD